jgi:microcystin-dependent protein
MSGYFLGEVRPFGGTFAPQGWTMCNGQLMAISQYTALFALIGTTYGGDGITTFGLPDLRGRAMIHQGTGLGLSPRTLGEISGTPNVTLLQGNLPVHMHSLNATATTATSPGPAGGNQLTGIPSASTGHLYVTQGTPAPTPDTLAGGACGPAGQSLPHENMMPSLTLTYIIALVGIFPTRN